MSLLSAPEIVLPASARASIKHADENKPPMERKEGIKQRGGIKYLCDFISTFFSFKSTEQRCIFFAQARE
jgi:hypothetical protein